MKKQAIVIDPFLLRGSIVFAKLTPDACKAMLWIASETFSVDSATEWEPHEDSIRFFRYDNEDQGGYMGGLEQLRALGIVATNGAESGLVLDWNVLAEMGITQRSGK